MNFIEYIQLNSLAFGWRQLLMPQLIYHLGNSLLLDEHTVAPCLGGMGRNRGLNIKLFDYTSRLLNTVPLLPELIDCLGNTFASRGVETGLSGSLTIDTRDFALLLRIHQMKEDGIVPQKLRNLIRGELRYMLVELRSCLFVALVKSSISQSRKFA